MEEWRPVLDGVYEVSSLGRARRAAAGVNTQAGRILKPVLMKIGYYRIGPSIGGKQWHEYVHHLVTHAFLGPKPKGMDVNHLDGVKTNNRVENLEYVSHRENMRHAGRLGVMRRNARFTDAEVAAIKRKLASGDKPMALADRMGVPRHTMSDIRSGHSYKHVAIHKG